LWNWPATVIYYDKLYKRLTYQNTLFPAPAAKGNYHQSLRKHKGWAALTFPVDP
jgi:hypothetical protein